MRMMMDAAWRRPEKKPESPWPTESQTYRGLFEFSKAWACAAPPRKRASEGAVRLQYEYECRYPRAGVGGTEWEYQYMAALICL